MKLLVAIATVLLFVGSASGATPCGCMSRADWNKLKDSHRLKSTYAEYVETCKKPQSVCDKECEDGKRNLRNAGWCSHGTIVCTNTEIYCQAKQTRPSPGNGGGGGKPIPEDPIEPAPGQTIAERVEEILTHRRHQARRGGRSWLWVD